MILEQSWLSERNCVVHLSNYLNNNNQSCLEYPLKSFISIYVVVIFLGGHRYKVVILEVSRWIWYYVKKESVGMQFSKLLLIELTILTGETAYIQVVSDVI